MSREERGKVAGSFRRFLRKGGKPAAALFAAAALLLFGSPSEAVTGYVSGLNTYPLRDVPQFSADPSGRLDMGLKIEILQEDAGWVRIRAGDQTGWMPSSVISREAPASTQVGPLRERMKDMETSLNRLANENKLMKEETLSLTEAKAALEKDLESTRRKASRIRNAQRTWDIALGGGLVIFGWVTGYALASASRRKDAKRKYVID